MEELKLPPGEMSSWNVDEYVLDVCPFCGAEEKFDWNVEKNVGSCFICGRWINNYKSLLYYCRDDYISEVYIESKPVVYNKQTINYLSSAWDFKKSREFLVCRGVSEAQCRKCSILFDPSINTMFVPITSISKELSDSFLWRKLPNGKWFPKKGTKFNLYAFGHEKIENSKKNILVCEGIFDLLSTGLEDLGIAMLGSHVPDIWYRWFKKHANKLVLWFDPDEAGFKATQTISEKCLYHGIPFSVITSAKDPKKYDRCNKEDLKFLQAVEDEINKPPVLTSRNYIIKC